MYLFKQVSQGFALRPTPTATTPSCRPHGNSQHLKAPHWLPEQARGSREDQVGSALPAPQPSGSNLLLLPPVPTCYSCPSSILFLLPPALSCYSCLLLSCYSCPTSTLLLLPLQTPSCYSRPFQSFHSNPQLHPVTAAQLHPVPPAPSLSCFSTPLLSSALYEEARLLSPGRVCIFLR